MNAPASTNNIPIEIPEKRWTLLCEAHPEVAIHRHDVYEAIEDPDVVYEGPLRQHIAVKKVERRKHLAVLYSEGENGGELITVYITRSTDQFDDMRIIWKKNT
jgi:hypothetical protein